MAQLLPWKQEYSVSVSKFDNQHKTLVQLINDLHMAMSTGNGKASLQLILEKLMNYTAIHFADEEKEMQRTKFPGYLTHKMEHDKLTAQVKDLYRKITNKQVVITMEVMNFLKDWLTNHILKVDKKYSDHLTSQGVR
ncbi:MAG: hemerythrin family protein [Melioribacteraceae bacterium]|nr:hemerythrin family protein [Melioribacteraceae bacterium]